MKKKTASGLMLATLLIGMLTLAFNIQIVKAEPTTWTVDDDGPADFTKIQDAVDAATAGDTITVYSGVYTENVNVNKRLTIKSKIGAEVTIVQAANPEDSVFEVTADYVTISGFTVKDATGDHEAGVYLYNSEHSKIENINATNNYYGVYLLSSSNNNTVSGNNITNNTYTGISIFFSSNNNVSRNNITANNEAGVSLASSSNNNTVSGNNITNNGFGVFLASSSNNNTVSGNNITNSGVGVGLLTLSSNTVSGNNIKNNTYGVRFYMDSDHNTVSDNNIINNTVSGVEILSSSNNTVSGNNIKNNTDTGVYLESSSNNTVSGNNITNSIYGVRLPESSGNWFYHNNFIDNTKHVNTSNSANFWDNGYPSGGNFWSNYTGVDHYRGPNQDKVGSDRIGDTPHVLDPWNQDNYPLVYPGIMCDITPPEFLPRPVVVPGDLTWTNQTSIVLIYVSGVETPELNVMTFNGSWSEPGDLPEKKNAPFSPDVAVNPEPVLFDPILTMVTTVNPEPVLFDPRINPEPYLFEPNIMIRSVTIILPNGTEWTGPDTTPSCTAMGVNPTVAHYDNETYLFWENANSTPSTIRVMNLTSMEGNYTEFETIGVGSQPTATVYNDELYVVWERNDTLVYKIYNGSNWSSVNERGLIDPQPTPYDPLIGVHDGLLYLTYEAQDLTYLQASNGTAWTGSYPLENYGDLSPRNPAITSFNNTLYLFYASMKDGHIYYQTLEGELGNGTWSTPTQVPAPVHYIKVENIIPSKTVVAQNHTVPINVTVENTGDFNETFNVIVYHTDPDTGKNPWDIPNSTQFEDYWKMGDVNYDGYIDLIDYNLIADQAFTSNPRYDIDESDLVDTDDLLICGINYGKDIWTHFNLTLSPIEKQTIEDLPAGNSTITFTWNTTGVPLGNYTISVVTGAWVANDWGGGSHDPPWMVVTTLGDVNGDSQCNILDVKLVKLDYSGWITDPNTDINDDGAVNILDLKLVKLAYSGLL